MKTYDAGELRTLDRALRDAVPLLETNDVARENAAKAILDAQAMLVDLLRPYNVHGPSGCFVLATALRWAAMANEIPLDDKLRMATQTIAKALFDWQEVAALAAAEQQQAAENAGGKPS